VDGTVVTANASPATRTKPEQLEEVAKVSRTVREYLADLAQANPWRNQGAGTHSRSVGGTLHLTTDPDAYWAQQMGSGSSSYYDHYLIDNASCIILGVEVTQARFRQRR